MLAGNNRIVLLKASSNMFCGFYTAAVVGIVSGRDVSIHTRREN